MLKVKEVESAVEEGVMTDSLNVEMKEEAHVEEVAATEEESVEELLTPVSSSILLQVMKLITWH